MHGRLSRRWWARNPTRPKEARRFAYRRTAIAVIRRLKLTAWLTFYWGVALMLLPPWTGGMLAVLAAWYIFCIFGMTALGMAAEGRELESQRVERRSG